MHFNIEYDFTYECPTENTPFCAPEHCLLRKDGGCANKLENEVTALVDEYLNKHIPGQIKLPF
jgi:hypothetical protein